MQSSPGHTHARASARGYEVAVDSRERKLARGCAATVIPHLPLHHALLYRFHRYPLRSQELHRALHLLLLAAEQDCHDPDLVLDAGLPDVEDDVGELAAHLPDDRLLHLRARGESEPGALGIRLG